MSNAVPDDGTVRNAQEAEGGGPLSADELDVLDRYWRAANYLTIGQIYLQDNPLLREPLRPLHAKPRLLGHWGTSPGLNLVYAHLNRLIRERGVDEHCTRGASVWEWASNIPEGEEPDIVLGCAGDIPTLETIAAGLMLAASFGLLYEGVAHGLGRTLAGALIAGFGRSFLPKPALLAISI